VSAHDLHYYRCSFCKTVASSTLRMTDPPLKCVLCLRLMAYLYATPISAEEWQARNLNPPVFKSPHAIASIRPEDRETKCARLGCHEYRTKAEMLNGRFCSEDCGAKDSEELAAIHERKEKLYQEMPWLRQREVTRG
jgi:hypothetical protein